MVKVEHVENRDGEEGIFVGEIEKTGPGQGGFPEQYGLTIEDDDALPYEECYKSFVNCGLIMDFIDIHTGCSSGRIVRDEADKRNAWVSARTLRKKPTRLTDCGTPR